MRMKFSLLILGRQVTEARFSFFLTDPKQVEDSERRFVLTPEQIAAINPNTKTVPVFRSRADADLTAHIYSRVSVLIDTVKGETGNPWMMSYASKLFDMTYDSGIFRTADELLSKGFSRHGANWIKTTNAVATRFVPLFEAKMLHIYDHRWATFNESGNDGRETTIEERKDPQFESKPRYWVEEGEVLRRLERQSWRMKWLFGLRKITNTTNQRTIIPTIFPIGGVGNSEHVLIPGTDIAPRQIAYLLGAMSSLIIDYIARQKLGGTNLNFFYVEQLPLPSPDQIWPVDLDFVASRVVELIYTSYGLEPFANDLGFHGQPFSWNEARRALLRSELDAFYARVYGLTRDELRYVLDPADVKNANYPSETFRGLKNNEIAKYGEYRTRRLVMEAWDRQSNEGKAA